MITDDWLFFALYLVFLFSFFYEGFDCFDEFSESLDSLYLLIFLFLYLTLLCSLSTVENHGLFLFHNGHRLPARFFDRQQLATLMCGIPACHYSMISVFFWSFYLLFRHIHHYYFYFTITF